MAVDKSTVQHIARLARIKVSEDELAPLADELSEILKFVEQLEQVDTEGVAPKTSGSDMGLFQRPDVVNDGNYVDRVTQNAPQSEMGFFTVPKVVE